MSSQVQSAATTDATYSGDIVDEGANWLDAEQTCEPLPRLAASDDVPDIGMIKGRTDGANARRFANQHRGKLLYCYSWKQWLIWTGSQWLPDNSQQEMQLAFDVTRRLWLEAADKDQEAKKHAMYSEGRTGFNAMIALAQSMMPVTVDNLDQHPWLLNCPNGTLHLQTGGVTGA